MPDLPLLREGCSATVLPVKDALKQALSTRLEQALVSSRTGKAFAGLLLLTSALHMNIVHRLVEILLLVNEALSHSVCCIGLTLSYLNLDRSFSCGSRGPS